jgi:hypothetical protein
MTSVAAIALMSASAFAQTDSTLKPADESAAGSANTEMSTDTETNLTDQVQEDLGTTGDGEVAADTDSEIELNGDMAADTETTSTDDGVTVTTTETGDATMNSDNMEASDDTNMNASDDNMNASGNMQATGDMDSNDTMRADTDQLEAYRDATVGDLVGKDVIGAGGETVGAVDSVRKTRAGIVAIVGVGGFLGLGEHDVAVPLSEIDYADGELRLSRMSEEQLEEMPRFEAETEEDAQALESDMRIMDNL